VVGIPNHGAIAIGDTLTDGEDPTAKALFAKQTFASFTSLPCASTTQTLDSSNDTSFPA
jgi:peptide subunit release factor RF-3